MHVLFANCFAAQYKLSGHIAKSQAVVLSDLHLAPMGGTFASWGVGSYQSCSARRLMHHQNSEPETLHPSCVAQNPNETTSLTTAAAAHSDCAFEHFFSMAVLLMPWAWCAGAREPEQAAAAAGCSRAPAAAPLLAP